MGEYAELSLELEEDIDIDFANVDSELYRRFHNNVWTDKDYKPHSLKEMSDSHLRNSIKWIKKYGPNSVYGFGAIWLPKLKQERINRGLA